MRNIHKDKKNVSVFNENKTTNIFFFEIYTRKRGTSNSLKQKIKNKKLKTKNLSNRLKMQISIDVSKSVEHLHVWQQEIMSKQQFTILFSSLNCFDVSLLQHAKRVIFVTTT